MNDKVYDRFSSYLCYFLLSVVLFIGIYARLKGIGRWSLAVDEYYIAKSVKNILLSGLPEFECGGYYVRGLLYQYISAAFIKIFNNDEYFLRLIPAISGLLAIPPIYWLGKKLSGTTGAVVAVTLFSLSIWEVEFSRFARMYTPFQSIFVWYFYCLYNVIVEKRDQYQKWMLILSLAAVFVYEGSIFLLLLNFFTILIQDEKRSHFLIIKVVLLIIGYSFLSYDFRHLGVTAEINSNIIPSMEYKGPLIVPKILLADVIHDKLWLSLSLIPVLLNTYIAYWVYKCKSFDVFEKLTIIAATILTLLNLFAAAFLLGLIMFMVGRINLRNFDQKTVFYLIAIVLFNLLFWTIFGLTNENWKAVWGIQDGNKLKNTVKVFFNYPDIYDNILKEWYKAIPKTTISAFILIIGGFIVTAKNKVIEKSGMKLFIGIIIILSFMIGALNTPYDTTRYTFFIYPIILILIATSFKNLIEYIGVKENFAYFFLMIVFTGCYMFISDDYSFMHIKEVDSKKINFRLIYDRHRSTHYYSRADYKTPAIAVNQARDKDDIVISACRPSAYYLDRLDYLYSDLAELERARGHLCKGRPVDLWTGVEVITAEKLLFKKIEDNSSVVWLIAPSERSVSRNQRRIANRIKTKYGKELIMTSMDEKVDLYRFARGEK